MKSLSAVLFAIAIGVGSSANGQECAGLPNNYDKPKNISVHLESTGDISGAGGRIGFGGSRAFAGVSMDYQSLYQDSDVDSHRVGIGVDGGLVFPVDVHGKFLLCPLAGYAFVSGPNISDFSGELRTRTNKGYLGVGGSRKFEFNINRAILPNARVTYAVSHQQSSVAGDTIVDKQQGAWVGGGAGVMFNRMLVIGADVNVPLGQKNVDSLIMVYFAIAFGRK